MYIIKVRLKKMNIDEIMAEHEKRAGISFKLEGNPFQTEEFVEITSLEQLQKEAIRYEQEKGYQPKAGVSEKKVEEVISSLLEFVDRREEERKTIPYRLGLSILASSPAVYARYGERAEGLIERALRLMPPAQIPEFVY